MTPWRRTAHQLDLLSVAEHARLKFQQTNVARRTGYAFDRWLSTVMRSAWSQLGGTRGQFGHTGDPLAFVPAGKLIGVTPLDALKTSRRAMPLQFGAVRSSAASIRDW